MDKQRVKKLFVSKDGLYPGWLLSFSGSMGEGTRRRFAVSAAPLTPARMCRLAERRNGDR